MGWSPVIVVCMMKKLITVLLLLVAPISFATIYEFDFEADEGFDLGPLEDQNGWEIFPNIPDQPTVSDSLPSFGSQHIRIGRDGSAGAGQQSGAFSPTLGVRPPNLSPSVHVDLYFSGLNGAAYDMVAQSVSQNMVTWRLRFTNTGDLLAFDAPGGNTGFYDTGVDYPVGTYFNLYVETRTQEDAIDFFLDGELIYSSVVGVAFGQSIEQIVFISNNQHVDDNEFMAFDKLIVDTDAVDLIFADDFETSQQ